MRCAAGQTCTFSPFQRVRGHAVNTAPVRYQSSLTGAGRKFEGRPAIVRSPKEADHRDPVRPRAAGRHPAWRYHRCRYPTRPLPVREDER
jgi:hypothetical protein